MDVQSIGKSAGEVWQLLNGEQVGKRNILYVELNFFIG